MNILTIDFTLVSLITNFAEQLCDTLLAVHAHGDRLVVVAEQAGEGRLCAHLLAHARQPGERRTQRVLSPGPCGLSR